MKKTVFLFIFLLFTSWHTSIEAGVGSLRFQFEDYEFRLEQVGHPERGRGYEIEKIGDTAFTVTKTYLNHKYYITSCTEINDQHVFFGYTHNYEGDNYYDPFVLILDKNGNEKFVFYEDFGKLEEVREVVIVDNVILVRIEQSEEDEYRDIVLSNNLVVSFDLEYNQLKTQEIDGEIKRSTTTDLLYVYDSDHTGEYSGAVTSELEVLGDTLDITNNQIFTDTATILFYNTGVLNGEDVSNGVTIEYPGNYELEYNGYTYRFVVEPIVTGVTDNEVYKDSVSPIIKSGKAYLNNDLFVSGETISEPGNYTLRIEGLHGYEKLITFSINSSVTGVLNDQTYDDNVQIEFEGEGYLNNTYIESPYTVTEDGEYLLKIRGEGNYLETYHFTVETTEEEPSIIDYIQKYDIVVLGIVVVIGGIILKKK